MQDYPLHPEKPSSGASFRVQGKALDLEAITRTLGISPSHSHKMGDPGPLSRPYALDMWMLSAPLDKALPLEAHLIWLSDALAPHHHSLNSIKETSQLDIYCHYTSYVEENRLTLSPRALRIFMDLALPLDLSSLYIPDDEPDSSELAAPPTIERI